MAKRSPVERAVAGIWKMIDGHDRRCKCVECRAKDVTVGAVAAVSEASSTAAERASAALTQAGGVKGLVESVTKKAATTGTLPELGELQPVVTVNGVRVRAEFVPTKKGR